MDEFVAHIRWDAVEVATGDREEGELFCRLEDVVIVPIHVLKGQRMMLAKMKELFTGKPPALEEIQRISEEMMALPGADEIESTLYHKMIQLSPRYRWGFGENAGREKLVGFGLDGDLGPIVTDGSCRVNFSWEWFNVKSPGVATKLQESGQITFEQAATALGEEIVRLSFDTDVSLRIRPQGPDVDLNPVWRIRICAGSEVRWPSLIDGKNVANGFVS